MRLTRKKKILRIEEKTEKTQISLLIDVGHLTSSALKVIGPLDWGPSWLRFPHSLSHFGAWSQLHFFSRTHNLIPLEANIPNKPWDNEPVPPYERGQLGTGPGGDV